MSHVWMGHVTRVNGSCHTYELVMAHAWMSHVTHVNESCHTCESVLAYAWMRHVTHMNEFCIDCRDSAGMCVCVYVCVHVCVCLYVCACVCVCVCVCALSRTWLPWIKWMRFMNESRQTCMNHFTHMNESCCMCVAGMLRKLELLTTVMLHMYSHVTHILQKYIHICDMTCSDSAKTVTAHYSHATRMQSCHAYIVKISFIFLKWLLGILSRNSPEFWGHVTRENESCHTCEWVMSQVQAS